MQIFSTRIYEYDVSKIYQFLAQTAEQCGLWDKLAGRKSLLLKPNLLGERTPERAVTTHPAVVEATVKLFREKGFNLLVGDSPGGTVSPAKVFAATGMSELAEKMKLELIEFGHRGIQDCTWGSFRFPLEKTVFEVDGLINLPKMKTHSMMIYTGAIKNLYGLIPGLQKAALHKLHPNPDEFARLLLSIYLAVKEKLVFNIMDGVIGMEGDGPSSGNPRRFGTMLAGESAPALDQIALTLMNFKNIRHVDLALQADGLLKRDIACVPPVPPFENVNTGSVYRNNRLLNSIPKPVAKLITSSFTFKPVANHSCVRCGICVKSCPVHCMKLTPAGLSIDYSTCIRCLCCHEMCPHKAIELQKGLLARYLLRNK